MEIDCGGEGWLCVWADIDGQTQTCRYSEDRFDWALGAYLDRLDDIDVAAAMLIRCKGDLLAVRLTIGEA